MTYAGIQSVSITSPNLVARIKKTTGLLPAVLIIFYAVYNISV